MTARSWGAQSHSSLAPWASRSRDADAGRSSLTRRDSPGPTPFVNKKVAVRAVFGVTGRRSSSFVMAAMIFSRAGLFQRGRGGDGLEGRSCR